MNKFDEILYYIFVVLATLACIFIILLMVYACCNQSDLPEPTETTAPEKYSSEHTYTFMCADNSVHAEIYILYDSETDEHILVTELMPQDKSIKKPAAIILVGDESRIDINPYEPISQSAILSDRVFGLMIQRHVDSLKDTKITILLDIDDGRITDEIHFNIRYFVVSGMEFFVEMDEIK